MTEGGQLRSLYGSAVPCIQGLALRLTVSMYIKRKGAVKTAPKGHT